MGQVQGNTAKLAASILSSPLTPYVFSISIVSLIFKQIQFNTVVGPMELFAAAVCIVLIFAVVACEPRRPIKPLVVASSFLLLVFVSAAFALLTDPQRLSIRDGIAYAFTFFVVCTFMLASYGRETRYVRALAFAISGVLFVFIFLAVVPNPLQAMMYYQGTKLQGLSNNPNQIGFLAAAGLSLLLVLDFEEKSFRPILVLASGFCGFAGTITDSSAFTLAIAVTFILTLAFFGLRLLQRTPQRLPFVLVLPVLFLVAAHLPLPEGTRLLPAGASSSAELLDMDADGGQGTVRLTLWRNALSAVLASPIVGLGPGPQVPLTDAATNTTSLNEAHNTVIDLLVVTGALGLVLFVATVGWILRDAYRARVLGLLFISVAPVGLFSLLHYEGRQPLFWIILYLASGPFVDMLRRADDSERPTTSPARQSQAAIAAGQR
ncbi:MAG: O-antigen ligase family protein [Devosia nanyangense]|nr:O-antigen ligase family protein [Devosia nanyangense]